MLNFRHTTDGAALDDLVRTYCVSSHHWHHYHPVVRLMESIHFHYHCVRAVPMKELQLRHHTNHHHHRSRLPVNQIEKKNTQMFRFQFINANEYAHYMTQFMKLRTFSTIKCDYVGRSKSKRKHNIGKIFWCVHTFICVKFWSISSEYKSISTPSAMFDCFFNFFSCYLYVQCTHKQATERKIKSTRVIDLPFVSLLLSTTFYAMFHFSVLSFPPFFIFLNLTAPVHQVKPTKNTFL